MKKILKIIVLTIVLIGFTTLDYCKKVAESTIIEIKPPGKVTTSGVLATSSNGAVLAGYVGELGGAEWYVRGICFDTIPDPEIQTEWYFQEDTFYLYLSGEKILNPGSFTERIYYIFPNTTYYARAFAVNEAGLTYGNQVDFTTNPIIS